MFCRVGSTVPRRVDVRFVAATHRDLEADVRTGRFREDLFYRLAVIRVRVPPLRERPEDVEPLARALLARAALALGRRDVGLGDDALEALRGWRWPGNVRELANVLERALVLRPPGETGPLSADEVASSLDDGPARRAAAPAAASLASKVDALERAEIETALRRARGVKARAAQALGLSRPTLDKKMADLDIDVWRGTEQAVKNRERPSPEVDGLDRPRSPATQIAAPRELAAPPRAERPWQISRACVRKQARSTEQKRPRRHPPRPWGCFYDSVTYNDRTN